MSNFLKSADECDGIHDVLFKVDKKIFPAHQFICSALHSNTNLSNTPTIELSGVHHEIFNQLLNYIYTGTCDLLICQKCPTNLENLKVQTKTSPSDITNNKTDPIRLLQDCAKQLGLRTLQKTLEDYYYQNGFIKCRNAKKYVPKMIKFDWNSCLDFCDVIIKTKNDKQLKAHKCILVARSEYFSNLFSLRWAEVKLITILKKHSLYLFCFSHHRHTAFLFLILIQ